MDIGARIKKRREELGMSQEELAHKVGYKSRSSINKIEGDGRGLPQKKIMAFAKALDTTPAYLMGWEEDAEKGTPKDAYKKLIDMIVTGAADEVFTIEKTTASKGSHPTPKDTHITRLKGIIRSFEKLNLLGQIEALKRVEELTYISKYVNKEVLAEYQQRAASSDYLVVNAAHALANATAEDIEHDEDIMDDDNF